MVELLQRARAVFHFFFRTLDLPLLGALCLLMVAGLAVLHSVDGPVHAQAMRYGAGLPRCGDHARSVTTGSRDSPHSAARPAP